jgi:IMP dehydrogenase/GMP reductase
MSSRSSANTSVQLGDFRLRTPIMSANMDTITGSEMAIAMYNAGGVGSLHRFMSIKENIDEYNLVRAADADCFVSVGVNDHSRERLDELYTSGARHFVIDIAHGHSIMMKKMLQWIKLNYRDMFIMAGNVATAQAVKDLSDWGANSIKVGISNGCFKAGSLVKTTIGKKPIEEIVVGDEVITHKNRIRKVTKTFIHNSKNEFTVINGIHSTPNHEFYVLHKKYKETVTDENIHEYAQWISAKNLTKDYVLLRAK